MERPSARLLKQDSPVTHHRLAPLSQQLACWTAHEGRHRSGTRPPEERRVPEFTGRTDLGGRRHVRPAGQGVPQALLEGRGGCHNLRAVPGRHVNVRVAQAAAWGCLRQTGGPLEARRALTRPSTRRWMLAYRYWLLKKNFSAKGFSCAATLRVRIAV